MYVSLSPFGHFSNLQFSSWQYSRLSLSGAVVALRFSMRAFLARDAAALAGLRLLVESPPRENSEFSCCELSVRWVPSVL